MVAMNVWPTDAANGSVANEARWRAMGRHFAPTCVLPGIGNELRPTLAYPNLTVQDGAAWVDGHYCELLGAQVLAATANGIAVVRFDPAANTAELLWRDGVSTPAQSPTGTFEMLVASTTGSVLTDRRVLGGRAGLGVLGWGVDVLARSGISNTPYQIPITIPVTTTAGRLLRATLVANLDIPGTGVVAYLRDGVTTVARIHQHNGVTGTGVQLSASTFVAPAAGAKSYNAAIQTVSGLLNVNGNVVPTQLVIEDIGTA